jgi:hypothetical protein
VVRERAPRHRQGPWHLASLGDDADSPPENHEHLNEKVVYRLGAGPTREIAVEGIAHQRIYGLKAIAFLPTAHGHILYLSGWRNIVT